MIRVKGDIYTHTPNGWILSSSRFSMGMLWKSVYLLESGTVGASFEKITGSFVKLCASKLLLTWPVAGNALSSNMHTIYTVCMMGV